MSIKLTDFIEFLSNIPTDIASEIAEELLGEEDDRTKKCTMCKRLFPETKFRYFKHNNTFSSYCESCEKEMLKQSRLKPVKYEVYKNQLVIDDHPRRTKNGYLSVRCKHCKKYFKPTRGQVQSRIVALNNAAGESSFYCSDKCKQECPIFNTKGMYQEGFQIDEQLMNEVKAEALKRAEYLCEICHETKHLNVHHINPKKISPIEAYDLENLIVLCYKCHMRYGHGSKDCSTGYLAHCKRKNT